MAPLLGWAILGIAPNLIDAFTIVKTSGDVVRIIDGEQIARV